MDVYSFGLIMWQLYHEKVPFDGNLVACTECVLQDTRPQIQERSETVVEADTESFYETGVVSGPIAGLIRKCWASDPEQRPEFNEILTVLWEETFYYTERKQSESDLANY